jgi:hypothetical protein
MSLLGALIAGSALAELMARGAVLNKAAATQIATAIDRKGERRCATASAKRERQGRSQLGEALPCCDVVAHDPNEDTLARDRSGRVRPSCGEMTTSALPQWFADPKSERAADDRRDRWSAEITSVERVGGQRISRGRLRSRGRSGNLARIGADGLGYRSRARWRRDGINRDDQAAPANRLAGKGQHVLHEPYAPRQIPAVGQKALELLRGSDNDEIGYVGSVGRSIA